MNQRDIANVVQGITPVLRDIIGEALAPALRSIAALEKRVDELPAAASPSVVAELQEDMGEFRQLLMGLPGPDGLVALVERTVEAIPVKTMIDEAIRRLPPAEPGKPGESVTIEQVAPLVDEVVARAVAALPPAEPGAPGTSVTKDDVAPMIDEVVGRAIAALPTPEPGKPGESVTVADVEPVIAAAVEKAVAALPKPKDGESIDVTVVEAMVHEKVSIAVAALPAPAPGRDADPAEVDRLVSERVADAVANLPKAKDGDPGKSVTLDDVAPLIGQAVDRAVAALPPAKEGPPGKLPVVRAWADRVYQEGDVVFFDGSSYQAQRLTGKPPSHEDWGYVARAGMDGRSFNPRSTWSATETYERLDVVALDGGAFVARRDNPGPCPGEGWMLGVMRGKAGIKGEKGDSIKGDRGVPGPAVVAIAIDSTGLVTLTNADGTTSQGDFGPVLARLGR